MRENLNSTTGSWDVHTDRDYILFYLVDRSSFFEEYNTLSGTAIKGTLIKGLKAPSETQKQSGNRTHSTQILSRSTRGPILARPTAQLYGTAHPGPTRTCGAISASLEASPSRPTTAHHISASLEGSGPTLRRAGQLRLGRALVWASAQGETPPRSRPPLRSWN